MAIENIIVEYLLSGQFWAANFFALVATIYWSFSGTGMSSGNLRHQVTLTNWTNRIRFASMFLLPGDAESDDEIIDHIRETAITIGHPLGTCKMGDDDMAVVDDQLRVHGVEGLWVVDASIMPTIPRGNTNAPTIMIAEKAADFINEER